MLVSRLYTYMYICYSIYLSSYTCTIRILDKHYTIHSTLYYTPYILYTVFIHSNLTHYILHTISYTLLYSTIYIHHARLALDIQLERQLAQETTCLMESFTLPDGRVIKLGRERFEAPEVRVGLCRREMGRECSMYISRVVAGLTYSVHAYVILV